MILMLYRLAWEPVWWIARALAAVSSSPPSPTWPASWRLAERTTVDLPTEPPRSQRDDRDRTTTTRVTSTYWLHAASLGECKGLWAFAQRLRAAADAASDTSSGARGRDVRILLTANTSTGLDFLQREIARLESPLHRRAFRARLAPLDHPRLTHAFLAVHAIRALVLFEVELWPHRIAAARRAGIPVVWLSARLTPRARRRYAGNPLIAGALRRVLRDITWTQTQTEDEEHALRRLGAARVETGGDLRGLHALDHARRFPVPRAEVSRRGIAFVSFHARELPVLRAALREVDASPPQPLFVFPRKLPEVPAFVRALAPYGFVLHSQYMQSEQVRQTEQAQRSQHVRPPEAARVIVDAYGLVEATLARVRMAVIGGSFDTTAHIGGHNAWEPLLARCRLMIGPRHHNQRALVERLQTHNLIHVARQHDFFPGDFRDDCDDVLQTRAEQERRVRDAFVSAESARLEEAVRRACAFLLAAGHCVPKQDT